jgi:predicted dehydrogenase
VGEPLRLGVVGCGAVSGQYFDTIARLHALDVAAVSDLRPERAAGASERTGARVLTTERLLVDPAVDLVVNLTPPAAHAGVALAAIAAGKPVYGEKPLAISTADGGAILAAAAAANVRVGCAPDTVLGTGIQTARKAVDDGRIGAPVAATATMVTPGHERWHPDPDFYYEPGGGPLFDMGPYYVTALVTMLGPVVSVIGGGSRTRLERTIRSGPRAGERVPVTTDSHVTGVLVHASGVLSTLLMSFDIVASRASRIEVHGEAGSLTVPDPNHFAGPVELYSAPAAGASAVDDGWVDIGATAGYVDSGRGYGLADMALAIAEERPHRAGDELGLHVLDIMESVQRAADTHTSVGLTTTCERPAAVAGTVDLTRG